MPLHLHKTLYGSLEPLQKLYVLTTAFNLMHDLAPLPSAASSSCANTSTPPPLQKFSLRPGPLSHHPGPLSHDSFFLENSASLHCMAHSTRSSCPSLNGTSSGKPSLIPQVGLVPPPSAHSHLGFPHHSALIICPPFSVLVCAHSLRARTTSICSSLTSQYQERMMPMHSRYPIGIYLINE